MLQTITKTNMVATTIKEGLMQTAAIVQTVAITAEPREMNLPIVVVAFIIVIVSLFNSYTTKIVH